ncbi:hypothetical protein CGLO_08188 [Colletotrichum gloeosporioides Cg-14]|uniref:Uncharacterized protein n=1 Tax=Colletotrichum gloeosporioides (strain Cg-14) TaxID=1237896 RepID=T0KH04_COLGC|nr:hypothetical protein CGLO_08188 [Colletotrichum gloeosporioides Cg-14]
MTIIEKETNLRESRVLQNLRPPEEACESCQYPVLVAVDIDIFGGVRMGGLAILDTAKLGSASNDGLMSTNNLVSDSSSWAYYLAAMFFRFGNPTKTSDPASHMKKLIPSGRKVILVQNGLGLPD